mmetsp:Transcript_33533/g.94338  ORF Transcript_33533/g.94338 Transcript_33533/m.94338 type:complete len:227 (-) Transcript_33533:3-683(-)
MWQLEDFFREILDSLPPARRKHAARFVTDEHLELLSDGHQVEGDLAEYVQQQAWWPDGTLLAKRGGAHALDTKGRQEVQDVVAKAAKCARRAQADSGPATPSGSPPGESSSGDRQGIDMSDIRALFVEMDRRRARDQERQDQRLRDLLERQDRERREMEVRLQQLQEQREHDQRVSKLERDMERAVDEWKVEVYKHLQRCVFLLDEMEVEGAHGAMVDRTVKAVSN